MANMSLYEQFAQGLKDESLKVHSTSGLRDERKQLGISTKKEPRYIEMKENSKSIVLVIKQFAAPFNPSTLQDDAKFNKENKFRPSLSFTSTVYSIIALALKDEKLRKRLEHKLGMSINEDMLSKPLSWDMIKALKDETELEVFTFDALTIRDKAITKADYAVKYAVDLDMQKYYNSSLEEREAMKPNWLAVSEVFGTRAYLESEALKATPEFQANTEEAQKEQISTIFKSMPLQGAKKTINYVLCMQLPLNPDGTLSFDYTTMEPKDLVKYFKTTKIHFATTNPNPMATLINQINSTAREENNIYGDFYETKLVVGTATPNKDGKVGLKELSAVSSYESTTIIHDKYPQLEKLIQETLDFITDGGKSDIEEVVTPWISVKRLNPTIEKKLYESLRTNYTSEYFAKYFTEQQLDEHSLGLSILYGDKYGDFLDEIEDNHELPEGKRLDISKVNEEMNKYSDEEDDDLFDQSKVADLNSETI